MLVSVGHAPLYEADARLVGAGCWFNDALLQFSFECDRVAHEQQHGPHSAGWWCALHPLTVALVRDAAAAGSTGADVRAFLCDEYTRLQEACLLLLPISDAADARHGGGTHWSLLVGSHDRESGHVRWLHCDSMGPTANARHARLVANALSSALSRDSSSAAKRWRAEVREAEEAPRQHNSSDCGAFVTACAHALVVAGAQSATEAEAALKALAAAQDTLGETERARLAAEIAKHTTQLSTET